MDALTTLLIGGTAALGFVALGLGGFVLGTHADGTPRRRGWPGQGSGAHAARSAGARWTGPPDGGRTEREASRRRFSAVGPM